MDIVTGTDTAQGGVSSKPAPQAGERSGWRAVLIGALLVPFSVYFGNYAYVVTQALLWGQTSLPRGPIFVLFLVALFNLAVRAINRKFGLSASEMVIIYAMIAISTCVSGFGMVQFLVNILPAGTYFSTPVNHYERFVHLIPAYLVPHDPKVIQSFYDGRATWYSPAILHDWAVPVAVWSTFIVVMSCVTLCITAIVSRPWIEAERLTFPLVELPVRIIRGAATDGEKDGGILTSKVMWAGFLVAGILESVNFLNYFYPSLPYIAIKPTHLETYLTTPPWNQIGMLTIAFYPFAIGIAYLLSRDVAFSCWFFYLVVKLENVVAAGLGISGSAVARGGAASPPYIFEQGVGAFLALGVILLARAYKQAPKLAAADANGRGQSASIMSIKSATTGAVIGIVALTAFATAVGLPILVSLAFWAIYLLVVTVLARIVSEAGAGWAWGPGVPVHGIIYDFAGVNSMPPKAITTFGLFSWFENEFRDSPMPQQIGAVKMSGEVGGNRTTLLWALVIASVVGTVAAFAVYLDIYYTYGAVSSKVRPALQWVGRSELEHVSNWLNNPTGPDLGALGGMAGGAALLSSLVVLRQAFVWWPLHPIGYVLAGTLSMEYMWCPFLIGWAIKTITLRYGGPGMYGKMLPFFLGLILGDYIVPMLWGLYGMAAHVQVYMAFPH